MLTLSEVLDIREIEVKEYYSNTAIVYVRFNDPFHPAMGMPLMSKHKDVSISGVDDLYKFKLIDKMVYDQYRKHLLYQEILYD